GEFLTIVGTFEVNTLVAAIAATGVILAAGYALYLYRRVVFGEIEKDTLKSIMDLNRREVLTLAPLLAATIFFGVYPAPILHVTEVSVDNLVANYHAALEAHRVAGDTGLFARAASLFTGN
ncbi:MAG: NADH-quinone oxidoreductase subunit M, partial [Nitratireductor sp.]